MSFQRPDVRPIAVYAIVLLSFLAACQQTPTESALPELPDRAALGFDDEPQQIRELIEAAYDELASAPSSEYATGKLAMLLHAHESLDAAQVFYQRAQALAPGTFQWPYLKGVILQQQGEPETAVAAFRTALDLLPGFAPARLRLADSLFLIGELEESERIYTAYVEEYKRAPRGLYGLGRICLEKKEWEKAAGYLQGAVNGNPNYGKAHQALAEALLRAGKLDEAKQHLEQHDQNREFEPAPPDPYLADVDKLSLQPMVLRRKALALIRARRFDEARQVLNQLSEIDPNYIAARALLMSIARMTGNDEEFLELFSAAIAVKQDYTPFHKEHGLYLAGKGRLEEAAAAYRKALEYDPQNVIVHWLFGDLRKGQGRDAEAETLYRRALELDPDFELVRSHLGRLLIARGKHREGVALLEACPIRSNDERARNALSLATGYTGIGKAEESRRSLDTAAALARLSVDKKLVAEVERRLGGPVY